MSALARQTVGQAVEQAVRQVRPPMVAAGRGLFLAVYGLAVSITLFVLAVVSIAFILLGVGVFTTPVVLEAVRRHAD